MTAYGACDGTLTSLIFNSWQANRRCRETVAATNGQRPTGDKAERTSLIFNSDLSEHPAHDSYPRHVPDKSGQTGTSWDIGIVNH